MAKVGKDSKFLLSSGGTNYFYINRKNKKKSKGETKLALRKYDPILRKHVLFEDKKLSTKKKVQAPKAQAGAPDAAKTEAPKVEAPKAAEAAKKPAAKKETAKK